MKITRLIASAGVALSFLASTNVVFGQNDPMVQATKEKLSPLDKEEMRVRKWDAEQLRTMRAKAQTSRTLRSKIKSELGDAFAGFYGKKNLDNTFSTILKIKGNKKIDFGGERPDKIIRAKYSLKELNAMLDKIEVTLKIFPTEATAIIGYTAYIQENKVRIYVSDQQTADARAIISASDIAPDAVKLIEKKGKVRL